jgi:molybdate transport system ATP-binding protein
VTARLELELHLDLPGFRLEVALSSESGSVAVLGPSGSGKTSLLECVAGLRRGARGRVRVDAAVLQDDAHGVHLAPELRAVGYVPQEGALFPHLSVRGNLEFGRRTAGSPSLAGLVELLELGPLVERYPSTLSGGERQRVALGRALATAPRLLLLDEPLASLDGALRERILPYLLRVRSELGVAMLYVTHHHGEALALGGDAALMSHGRLTSFGPAASAVSAGTLASADPAATLDNVVVGALVSRDDRRGTGTVRLDGGLELSVPARELDGVALAGGRVVLAVGDDELLVATEALAGISARNVFAGQVTGVDSSVDFAVVRVQAGGIEWRARVTSAAAQDLGLEVGRRVWIALKAHALRRLH